MQADSIDWEHSLSTHLRPALKTSAVHLQNCITLVSGNLLHAINMLVAPLDMLRDPVLPLVVH